MDAIAALSLAGTVFQITEFVATVLSKSVQLYTSADGSLIDNSDAAKVTTHLRNLSAQLRQAPHSQDSFLDELCNGAQEIAERLLAALDKLKVKGKQSRAESLRKALRSVWGKEELVRLETRLGTYRAQLLLHICARNGTLLGSLASEQSKGFKKLEDYTRSESKALLDALREHQTTTWQRLDTHIDQVLSLHTEVQRGTHQALLEFKVALEAQMKDRSSVKFKDQTRTRLSVATERYDEGVKHGQMHDIPVVSDVARREISSEIGRLRQDITSLAERLSQIEEDRRASDQELKRIILATSSSDSNASRQELHARGQQQSFILMLLQTLYDHLTALLLTALQGARALLDPLTYTTMILPALGFVRRLRKHMATPISFIADSSHDCCNNKDAAVLDSTSEGDTIFRSFKEVVSGVEASEMIWGNELLNMDGENSKFSRGYNICDAMPMNLLEKGRFQLHIELSA